MALQPLTLPSFNSCNDYHIIVSASSSYLLLKNKSMAYTRLPHQVELKVNIQVSYQSPELKNQSFDGYMINKVFHVPSDKIFSEQSQESVTKIIDLMDIPFSLNKNVEWNSLYLSHNGIIRCERSLENRSDMVMEIVKYAHSIRDCPPLYLDSLKINLKIKKTVMLPHEEFVAWTSAAKALSRTNGDFMRDYYDLIQGRPMRQLERRIGAVESLKEESFEGVSDDANSSMELCAVCREKFMIGSKVMKTPCSHVYHENCLLTWLKVNISCPYCRSDLSKMPKAT